MYVCICNGINDRSLCAAVADAETVADVYRRLGCRPQCGKCVPRVLCLLRLAGAAPDRGAMAEGAPDRGAMAEGAPDRGAMAEGAPAPDHGVMAVAAE